MVVQGPWPFGMYQPPPPLFWDRFALKSLVLKSKDTNLENLLSLLVFKKTHCAKNVTLVECGRVTDGLTKYSKVMISPTLYHLIKNVNVLITR